MGRDNLIQKVLTVLVNQPFTWLERNVNWRLKIVNKIVIFNFPSFEVREVCCTDCPLKIVTVVQEFFTQSALLSFQQETPIFPPESCSQLTLWCRCGGGAAITTTIIRLQLKQFCSSSLKCPADLGSWLVQTSQMSDLDVCAQSHTGLSLVHWSGPRDLIGGADKGGWQSRHRVSPVARGTCARVRALEEGRKEPFSHVIAGLCGCSRGSNPLTSHPVVLYSALRALVPSFSGSLSRSVEWLIVVKWYQKLSHLCPGCLTTVLCLL